MFFIKIKITSSEKRIEFFTFSEKDIYISDN